MGNGVDFEGDLLEIKDYWVRLAIKCFADTAGLGERAGLEARGTGLLKIKDYWVRLAPNVFAGTAGLGAQAWRPALQIC
jgi:hypothetical protein